MDEVAVGIAALERTPLLAGLDHQDLQEVLGCRQRVSFERGQAIVEQGSWQLLRSRESDRRRSGWISRMHWTARDD
jgi:hypothetical protein